ALQVLDKAIELDPKNAWTLARKGDALRMLEHYDEALQVLDKAIELDPKNAWTLTSKGNALRMLNRYDKALQVLDKAIELDPEDAWALSSKGDTLRMLNRYDVALQVLDKAIELDPKNAWALSSKGDTLRMLGRCEEALQSLDKSLELNPGDDWTLMLKGVVFCDVAQYGDALVALDRALELNPSDPWSHGFKGLALERLGKSEDALEMYKKATKLDPENLTWQAGVANVLYTMGQIKETSRIYSFIIDTAGKRPVDADILSQIAWCNYRLKAYDEAIRLYREALALDAGNISIQFTLALSFICSGRLELGLQEYRKGIEMSQKKSLLTRRGLIHEALHCLNEAQDARILSTDQKEVQDLFLLLQNEEEKAR
ncbi:MAG: tetratricopeptide repeat protein, partial [Candidatus Methanomethylicus sp.]|nr:tetratricopeptide repeat protein [Candidatus Methanomethylicus sp.]